MKNVIKKKKRRSKKTSLSTHPFPHRNLSVFAGRGQNTPNMESETNIEAMTQSFEGVLSKYTNIMKGWQFRWFILDPKTGILSYYISRNDRLKQPKGWTSLQSAVISPCEEDPNAFSVISTCDSISFKLRARDSKSRQEWINRLRAVSQLPTATVNDHHSTQLSAREKDISSKFASVKRHIFNAEKCHMRLCRTLDELPSDGRLRHLDPDLLTLKALSRAVIVSLNECFLVLQQKDQDLISDIFEPFNSKYE